MGADGAHPYADCDAVGAARLIGQGRAGNPVHDAGRNLDGLIVRRQGQQHTEFFTAQAARYIRGPELGFDHMGKLCQRSVTLQVAQFVVDGFEMVQIQHEQGKRRSIGACLFVHLGGRFQKSPAVGHAGEHVSGGLGVRYRITENTEIGLFHYRYHERIGSMFFDFSGSTEYSSLRRLARHSGVESAPAYRLGYFDDVKLTGISFSSKIGDSMQYAGDLSYRDGASVYLDNGAPTTGQIWQGNLNASYILGPSFLAQQTTFMGEVVHQRIQGVDKLTVSGGGAGVDGVYDTFESATQTRGSTLLGIGAYMDYPSIANGVDLTTKLVWTQNVDGSAYQGLGRDEKRLTVGGDFKYLGNFQVGLTYVAYLSSPDVAQGRLMADRDYLSLNAKYTF